MRTLILTIGLIAGLAAAPASAQTPPPPGVLTDVYQCAGVTDSAARLACYDQAVGRLRQAQDGGQLVAVDRGQIETLERESFGFRLPTLSSLVPNFGGDDDGDEGLSRLELVVERVVTRGSGRQALVMANGQIWADIEIITNPTVRDGDTVIIRRGPLGNFLMSSPRGGAARRVRRES